MPEKPVIETVKAPYHFTPEEATALGKSIVERMREQKRTEAEAKSIAADYKAKLARIDTSREELAQRIADGFEMRDTLAIVVMEDPAPGRKTYYRVWTDNGAPARGEAIRSEEMSYEDKQRKLPLEEKPPTNEDLAQTFDAAAPTKDTPPAGYVIVTGDEVSSQDGDLTFSTAANDWQPVEETGHAASFYAALARPIEPGSVVDTELPDEPLARKDDAARTPFGEALHAAAAGADLPLVPVVLSSDFTAEKAIAQFRKAARKNKWPEAALDLLETQAKATIDPQDAEGSIKRVLTVLNPHTVQEAK